jgi:hypothetical protein
MEPDCSGGSGRKKGRNVYSNLRRNIDAIHDDGETSGKFRAATSGVDGCD